MEVIGGFCIFIGIIGLIFLFNEYDQDWLFVPIGIIIAGIGLIVYPIPTIIIIAALLVAFIWYIIHSIKVEKQKKANLLKQAKERQEKWENGKKYYGCWNFIQKYNIIPTAKENQSILNRIVMSKFIIDTCIWMDTGLDCFFEDLVETLKKNNSKIILLGDIYEEIVRLKKGSDETGYKARVALKRVQYLLDSGLIISNGIKKEANPYVYADETILSFFERENNITILTHDAELKVRMSLLTNENKTANHTKQIFDIKLTKYATTVQN